MKANDIFWDEEVKKAKAVLNKSEVAIDRTNSNKVFVALSSDKELRLLPSKTLEALAIMIAAEYSEED